MATEVEERAVEAGVVEVRVADTPEEGCSATVAVAAMAPETAVALAGSREVVVEAVA